MDGMRLWGAVFFIMLATVQGICQEIKNKINSLEDELIKIDQSKVKIEQEIESLKLISIREQLNNIGLPSDDNIIVHQAYMLSYNEAHEQANWVAHIITPDIINGSLGRTNDFRADSLVSTGSAVTEDYFLTIINDNDNKPTYDGFGYDRGHLAPSADFRWSAIAVSESYFYSNMSPMLPAFNREKWADIEALLRGYVINHAGVSLYVVSLPVLEDGLHKITRGVNKVSIPETFIKVALDLTNRRGISFIMDHTASQLPIESYAYPIDKAEELTGFDFYNKLEDQSFESEIDKKVWFPNISAGDVEAIHPLDLPRGFFNTLQAKLYMGTKDEITVCGTPVSTRFSSKGHFWISFDKKYPNQIFSVYIRKEDFIHFPYDLKSHFSSGQYCVTGEVGNIGGLPAIRISKDKDITPLITK